MTKESADSMIWLEPRALACQGHESGIYNMIGKRLTNSHVSSKLDKGKPDSRHAKAMQQQARTVETGYRGYEKRSSDSDRKDAAM